MSVSLSSGSAPKEESVLPREKHCARVWTWAKVRVLPEEEKNMSWKRVVRMLVVLPVVFGALGSAVAQMPNPYGAAISVENAKKAAAPALAEAAKNHWTVAVAIAGPGGTLIYFEKMDNTQLGSAEVAIDKARTAARFKRPTKAFQDTLAGGGDGLRILGLKDVVPIEGGIPLVMDGKIVGAIGVSGATSAQDAQCAKAGAETVK
jgi:glc operon protein GlcG